MNPFVNFIIFLFKCIPPILRLEPLVSFVVLFSHRLNVLNVKFVYEIGHTGQIASLEHFLNDQNGLAYDLQTRDADITAVAIIWIDESIVVPPVYMFNQEEMNPPLYFRNADEVPDAPVYFRNVEESYGFDFIVKVPSTLTYDEPRLKAQVNKYRSAGKRFKIETY